MPAFRRPRALVVRLTRLALLGALSLAAAPRLAAQSIPARLSDQEFWRMVTEMSEPGGYFRSDNFISNETSFQYVIPELQRTIKQGGVYLGVAPDQNFTYIVALRPAMAIIVDIRRQAMLQHLMYKAVIEMSSDRAEFLARLFSRPRPAGLDSASTVEALIQAFAAVPPDTALYRRNIGLIEERLLKGHGFALPDSDLRAIEYVYDAFVTAGLDLTYNFRQGYGGGFGGRGMPTWAQLMLETDGEQHRSYIATEANYRILRDIQMRNLLVPIVGNFAGDKALRAVGAYLKEHRATVTTFYTSNVEQYLFQQTEDWRRFYGNVQTLPIDETSTFIRSLSGGGQANFRAQSPYSRSIQLICSMSELLKAFGEGRIQQYYDVIFMSRQ